MLVLPSELVHQLQQLEAYPARMVLFASLVFPLCMGLLAWLWHWVAKGFRFQTPDGLAIWFSAWTVMTWLVGAVSQTVLLVLDPSGIEQAMIWLATAAVLLLFSLTHRSLLDQLVRDINEGKVNWF